MALQGCCEHHGGSEDSCRGEEAQGRAPQGALWLWNDCSRGHEATDKEAAHLQQQERDRCRTKSTPPTGSFGGLISPLRLGETGSSKTPMKGGLGPMHPGGLYAYRGWGGGGLLPDT